MGPAASSLKLLVTGGVRSGKSRYAQSRAEALQPQRVFLATAQALDDDMRARIQRHQADRDATWTTIEEPMDVELHLDTKGVVLLDCLTLWVSNLLLANLDDPTIEIRFDRFCSCLHEVRNPVVVVTNEVGFGIVPPSLLGRRFRDLAGTLAQKVAAVSNEVVMMCAGIPLQLK